jgi:PAS domain S-box-containing protein
VTPQDGGPRLIRAIRGLKIGPRLALGFLLVILLMLGTNAMLLWQLQVIRAQTAHLNSIDRKLIAVLRVHTNLVWSYDRLEELVEAEDAARMVREAESLRSGLASEGGRARDALSRLPPDVQLDTTKDLTLQAVQRSLGTQLQALTELASHGDWGGVRLRLVNEIRPLQSLTSKLVADVASQVDEERAAAFMSIDHADRRIVLTVSVVGALTVLIAAVLGVALTRSITQPLGRLMQGSQALARGDFAHRVSVLGGDELAHLGRVFNTTAGQLRGLYDTLKTSEAYLAEAQRLSATGSFGWDVSTRTLLWSEETYRVVGLDRGTPPTLDEVLRRVHPDDVARVRETIDRATDARAGLDFEHRLIMTDGSVKHVRVVARVAEERQDRLEYVGAVTDVTALRRSQRALETALREMEALKEEFRLAVDTIPGLVWTALPDGHVDFLNHRWREYTGCSLEEAGGWGWQVAVHPQDLPRMLEVWRDLLASDTAGEVEARLRRFDGRYRWFSYRAVPLRDDRGRVVKWYGQMTDIEDRKRAEAVLAAEKRLLEIIAKGDSLPPFLDALCRCVEDVAPGCLCSVLLVEANGQRVRHGAAPSLPRAYSDALDGRPVTAEAGPCGMAAALKQQVIVEDVASDARWDGYGWRALALEHGLRACWSTPIVSHDGRVLGTFALSFRDPGRPTPQHRALIEQFRHIARIAIERAQTEDALKRSEGYLAEAQRLTQTGSYAWSVADEALIHWSRETYRLWGFDPDAGIPSFESFRERIHPDDRAGASEALGRTVRDGVDNEITLRAIHPDGTVKHIHSVGHPVVDAAGGVVEVVGTNMDVTERVRAQETLETARAELAHVARVATLGELTASIAHEVNQPLSGIMTNASTCLRLLAANPPNLEEAADTARRTLRDAKRAAEVITRLRQLFRKKETASEAVDINEAIREVIALARHQMQTGGVALRTELADGLPEIAGDRVQLQQVVLNLVLNAAEAMDGVEGRPRDLMVATLRGPGDEVRVEVRDSGVGLTPDAQDRIFNAFYTTKQEGMGMGLSIARSIVESHGGRVWARPNQGPGATFTFTLPLPRAANGVAQRGAGRA